MGRNIEIKARIHDLDALKRTAAGLSDCDVERILQEDIFFPTPAGRLKLRILTPNRGELIYYRRDDSHGAKQSDYIIHPTDDPSSLKTALAAALGIRGTVKKTRWLYMYGQTRIHLDDVEGLGSFLELEVVLSNEQTREEGERITAELMQKLGIRVSDLIDVAYIDLLERSGATT
ncbi:class IV adenylate cyclase [Candidatus Eisenbacteria bacterium]|uniref:Class IV adenylate cyclase n=1 Tax=Eiseniibacteriota bacterium TaxID=2212470 RepID=A0ABV6YM50_UNCEI